MIEEISLENVITRTLTEQSINTTRGTNKWDAWICNGMKKGATYNTNDINDCHSYPLKIVVVLSNC